MATTHNHPHDHDSSDEGMGKTLVLQASILGGFVFLLILASLFGII